MYIVRDIFQLKFGQYKQAKELLDEAQAMKMFEDGKSRRVLSDFTGDAYRLVLEQGFDTLADYENHLKNGFSNPDWGKWYGRFREHIVSSHREIMKQVM